MPDAMLVRLLLSCLLLPGAIGLAQARSASARIERVSTAVATLRGVQIDLDWPHGSVEGNLRLRATQVEAPDLGYRFRDLDWRCPLRRDGQGGWRCDGELRSGRGAPFRLSLDLGPASTDARLSRNDAAVTLSRMAATPDATRIDLTRVPLAWTQALLAQAWPEARLTSGRIDSALTITAAADQPLRIAGPLSLQGAAFDTPDGTIAAENLGARLRIDTHLGDTDRVALQGHLLGGELLFGNTYISLQQRAVDLSIDALKPGEGGWQFPRLRWRDGALLSVEGSATLTPELTPSAVDLRLRSDDLAPLRDAYLSGWLGVAGLGDLSLGGAFDARLMMSNSVVRTARVALHQVSLDDPNGRFRFAGLDGDVAFSGGASVDSALRWDAGGLYGLSLGPAHLPLRSADGVLSLLQPASVALLGGEARLDSLQVRPPQGIDKLDVRFGFALERVDVGQLAKAFDWPAFTGQLSGRIPLAHYRDDRLTFDGGLGMQLFGGQLSMSSLSMERPFGTAPTLSANIDFNDLDLQSLTGVFGFGSITGTLDGRLHRLRLVDWQPVAFDAQLRSDRKRGVPQRISQRAVQDLSSVGDSSFVGSLQAQVIGLFDDFGYSRLGIGCVLADEVCTMDGLGSAGRGFIIVQGAGLPRLTVVGYNRRVDWPTLLERLAAVGKGDVKPVVE